MSSFRNMSTAPRDGTVIEIENSYGIRPHYGLYRWVDDGWKDATDPQHGLASEGRCCWRPFKGDPSRYVDPTGGAQFTPAYWGGRGTEPFGGRGGGMVLQPGQSMSVSVGLPIPREIAEQIGDGQMRFVDVSAETFGKYQHCTMAKDGMWYADSDFTSGAGSGRPKRGALPSPQQRTPELTAKARAAHAAAAERATRRALVVAKPRPWWRRLFGTA